MPADQSAKGWDAKDSGGFTAHSNPKLPGPRRYFSVALGPRSRNFFFLKIFDLLI